MRAIVLALLLVAMVIGVGAALPGAVASAQAGTMTTYHPLVPFRIADTRPGSAEPYQGQTLGPRGMLNVQVTGVDDVPVDATAATVNVTVTGGTGGVSFLTVFPQAAPQPFASNLNWSSGQTVSNLVQVGLGPTGEISLYNNVGTVNVIVDLQGYYEPSTSTEGLFHPVTPFRIADTRSGSGQPYAGDSIGPHSSLDIQATGEGEVPGVGSVSAVVVNLTGTNPTANTFLSVYPEGVTRPFSSNLNLLPGGRTRAIRVVVPVSPEGQITVYNNLGRVDVVMDITGWFTSAAPGLGGSEFTPITPVRVVDTRDNSGHPYAGDHLGPADTLPVAVAGAEGIPSDVTAVSANVTATMTTGISYLTVYPSGAGRPLASDLNWGPGETVPNLAVVGVGSDGGLDIYNNLGSTDVVVDVSGYYQAVAQGTIYWTTKGSGEGDGAIMSANLDDPAGTVTTLVSDLNNPEDVAVGNGHIYWTNPAPGDATAGSIWEADLDGSNPTQIVSDQAIPFGIAVDSSNIYWANYGGDIMDASLASCNPTCTQVNTLASGAPDVVSPQGVAVVGTTLYWANTGGPGAYGGTIEGQVMEADLTSCTPTCTDVTTLVSQTGYVAGVAANSSQLFWSTWAFSEIWSGELSDPQTTAALIVSGQNPTYLALDTNNIYWAWQAGGTIMAANLDGDDETTLVSGQDLPTGIAVSPP